MTESKVTLPPYSKNLNPEKLALLIIDMQRYFVDPDHPFGKFLSAWDPEGSRYYFESVKDLVIPNIKKIQEKCRASGAYIGYTELGSFREDKADMPGWARRHNEAGLAVVGSTLYPTFDHPSCRVTESLAPLKGEAIIQKNTSGSLNSTKLDQTLRVLRKDTIIVTGVVTDVCVAQTAREFGDRDFDVIVISDACCSTSARAHEAALETIDKTFGFVLSTDELLELL